MNRSLIFWMAVLLVAGGGAVLYTGWRLFEQRVAEEEQELAEQEEMVRGVTVSDFRLTAQTGRPFEASSLQGDVWIASFFFASCAQSCVRQNEIIQDLHEDYGSDGVKFVSITCDPDNDSPEVLREYASRFAADPEQWFFLTDEDLTYIRRIGVETFQLLVDRQTHADRLVLVDKWGNIRGRYNWHDATDLRRLRDAMDECLEETEPPAPADA